MRRRPSGGVTPFSGAVARLDAIPEHSIELFQMAVELKLEGLVAKRASSIYVPGERTRDWRKIKRPGAGPLGSAASFEH